MSGVFSIHCFYKKENLYYMKLKRRQGWRTRYDPKEEPNKRKKEHSIKNKRAHTYPYVTFQFL